MLRELREDELLVFRNNEVEFLNRSALVHIASFDEHYIVHGNLSPSPDQPLTSPDQ
jgi:hypothetical protein